MHGGITAWFRSWAASAALPIMRPAGRKTVTVHGAVRSAARPLFDKVVVPVGIQPIARGNFKWLDAVTIHGRLGRGL